MLLSTLNPPLIAHYCSWGKKAFKVFTWTEGYELFVSGLFLPTPKSFSACEATVFRWSVGCRLWFCYSEQWTRGLKSFEFWRPFFVHFLTTLCLSEKRFLCCKKRFLIFIFKKRSICASFSFCTKHTLLLWHTLHNKTDLFETNMFWYHVLLLHTLRQCFFSICL